MYIGAVMVAARPGKNHEMSEAVKKMRDAVHQITGIELTAWAGLQGVPVGSFAFTHRYESTGEWIEMWSKLIADEGYHKLSSALGELAAAPAETANSRVIAATTQDPPKPLLVVTTATMAGSVTNAMTWAAEMQTLVTEVSGIGGLLLAPTTGAIFDVTWSFGYSSADELDAASDKINGDPAYLAKLDASAGLFVEGSARRALLAQMP